MFWASCKNQTLLKFSSSFPCQYLLYLDCLSICLNVLNLLCNHREGDHSGNCSLLEDVTLASYQATLPQSHLTTHTAHTHFLLSFKRVHSMCVWILSLWAKPRYSYRLKMLNLNADIHKVLLWTIFKQNRFTMYALQEGIFLANSGISLKEVWDNKF